jgi:hypothetical protein
MDLSVIGVVLHHIDLAIGILAEAADGETGT